MAKAKKLTPKELYWARKNKEEQEKVAFLPPGLVNHGNTCFMNSVIQGLVATDLLEDLVRFRVPSQRFIQPLASRRSPLMVNGRGPEDIQQEWVRGMIIGDIFIHTLERAWRMRDARDRSSMSPKELLTRLGQKYDQYLDFRQQDAHEFFLHLLDGMRMEEFDTIKYRQPRPPPKSSKQRTRDTDPAQHVVPDVIPEEERLMSFVDMLWGGKFTSVLICATCKHVSHTYEDFDDLSLSISHDESKERKRDRLRAFASKFMTRPRDQERPRPQSVSQPPSPSLHTTTLEPMDEPLESSRRRSFEDSSPQEPVPEPAAERNKKEILAGFRNGVHEDGVGDLAVHPSGLGSRKMSDVGLGKLGRRISVGMSLGPKKEKKHSGAEKDHKSAKVEGTKLSGKSSEVDEDRTPVSPASSKPVSRQPSPAPTKKPKGPTKLPKPSQHTIREAAYLRRLLEDTTPSLSNPLAVLRMATPSGSGVSSAWSKISSTQGVEDCLRMFTAVEALDHDNMFGCHNCWKIANGQAPAKTTTQPEDDSDDSSDEEERGEEVQLRRPQVLDPVQSFSMPNLPPSIGEGHSTPTIPQSTKSSPFRAAFDPSLSDVTGHNPSALDLNLGRSASTSTTSLDRTPSQANGFGKPFSAALQDEEASSMHSVTSEAGTRELSIPTIATTSPDSSPYNPLTAPHPNRAHYVHFPNRLSKALVSSRDSLRLPEVHPRHHRDVARDGESSVSSEESERDDTSGVSDGDASVASVSRSVDTRRPRRSSLPRSKQVIYRRALKRYLIARPPPILVIHLKRFQQVSKSPVTLFGNLKKLDDYVSFPEYLDIRPFLAPKKEDYGLGKGELKGKVVEKGKREEDQPCVYRLYAVVVHIGNMLGGHYIAYTALPLSKEYVSSLSKDDPVARERESVSSPPVSEKGHSAEPIAKQDRQWCYISDTVVRLVSLEEVLKAKAYLCMYERVR